MALRTQWACRPSISIRARPEWSEPCLIGCLGVCAVAGSPFLGSTRRVEQAEGAVMSKHTLGIDLGVRTTHVATLCDERGEVIWSKRRFGNCQDELVAMVAQVGDCDELTVVMEATRNAWVPVAAQQRCVGRDNLTPPIQCSAGVRGSDDGYPRTPLRLRQPPRSGCSAMVGLHHRAIIPAGRRLVHVPPESRQCEQFSR